MCRPHGLRCRRPMWFRRPNARRGGASGSFFCKPCGVSCAARPTNPHPCADLDTRPACVRCRRPMRSRGAGCFSCQTCGVSVTAHTAGFRCRLDRAPDVPRVRAAAGRVTPKGRPPLLRLQLLPLPPPRPARAPRDGRRAPERNRRRAARLPDAGRARGRRAGSLARRTRGEALAALARRAHAAPVRGGRARHGRRQAQVYFPVTANARRARVW
jgi:hypothetical protein